MSTSLGVEEETFKIISCAPKNQLYPVSLARLRREKTAQEREVTVPSKILPEEQPEHLPTPCSITGLGYTS